MIANKKLFPKTKGIDGIMSKFQILPREWECTVRFMESGCGKQGFLFPITGQIWMTIDHNGRWYFLCVSKEGFLQEHLVLLSLRRSWYLIIFGLTSLNFTSSDSWAPTICSMATFEVSYAECW